MDRVLFKGPGSRGLPSSDGPGELVTGVLLVVTAAEVDVRV